MDLAFPFSMPGKPHNWGSPNLVAGENETMLYARWHPALARAFANALGDTGHAWLRSARGAEAGISLLQIEGGEARYIVAVNDSHVGTQADWHQVREELQAAPGLPPDSVIYDCTAERLQGRAPFVCDLSMLTARIFAVLPRELASIDLRATRSPRTGESIALSVAFNDAAGKPLAAVLPFHVEVTRPDGALHQDFYRATGREGTFAMSVPLGRNLPAGTWTVAVRSQLTGQLATLPVDVRAARAAKMTATLEDPAIVRERAAIAGMLAKGSRPLLPVFASTNSPALLQAAARVRAQLARQGVDVEILANPPVGTYTLTYDPSETQKVENARIDAGELIGRIRRDTVNANDWFSARSGWRCARPLILLDLAGVDGDNPMAESLDAVGILWPRVSAAFPGAGRAVVQGIPWAFAPRVTTLVIQATDTDGLVAGAQALGRLPADRLTPGIRSVRQELWRQRFVGGEPATPDVGRLSARGLAVRSEPRPFVIDFPGDKPLPADQVTHPTVPAHPAYPVPGTFEPKQYVIFYRDPSADAGEGADRFVETATAGMLVPDLRFSEAVMVVADVKEAGTFKIAAEGVFRYSDRTPCWQAQWEDIINLRAKLVPGERRPIEFEVRLNGEPAGKLLPVRTEQREVQLELASPTAGMKPRTVEEEVVTRCEGELELPVGRQEILLVHRNIVDGKLNAVGVGAEPPSN
jgi:hypothetical protein